MTIQSLNDLLFWVLRASWQGSVLVVLVLLSQRLLRPVLSAAGRYGLWYLVLVRLVLPVSLGSMFSIFNLVPSRQIENAGARFMGLDSGSTPLPSAYPNLKPSRPVDDNSKASLRAANPLMPTLTQASRKTAEPHLWVAFRRSALGAIPFIWLAGVFVLTGRLLWVCTCFSRGVLRRRPVTEVKVLCLVDECRRAVGLRKDIWVVETPQVRSPALFGISVPKLLLPEGFLKRFSEEQLRFVFLHELSHLKRHDIAWNWLIAALQILHWFNPVIWFAFRRLRSDREITCDARALRNLPPSESKVYGETILKLLEGFSSPSKIPGMAALLEDGRLIHRRFEMISRHSSFSRGSYAAAAAAALVLACVGLTDTKHLNRPGLERQSLDESDQQIARKVNFRVVDSISSRPISGAALNSKALTDAEGHAVLILAAPLNVRTRAAGYVPRLVNFPTEEELHGEYTLRLDRAMTVGGIVRDDQGNPVPHVEVHIIAPDDVTISESSAFQGNAIFVETDAQGRWACSEIPTEFENVSIKLVHADFLEALYCTGPVPVSARTRAKAQRVMLAELEAGRAEMSLSPGLLIPGRVFDTSGRPIEGAEVSQGYTWAVGPFGRMITASDGTFLFRNGPTGKMTLKVTKSGFAPFFRTFDVVPHMKPLEFYVARGEIIRGRVLDEDGRPVTGVRIDTTPGSNEFDWHGTSDSEGRFQCDTAPARIVTLIASAAGYVMSRTLPIEPGNRVHEIVLPRLQLVLNPA